MSPVDRVDPEHEALVADSVGLALLVVLERLAPAERLAFVLHDMFDVPFDQLAPLVGRSTTAVRQLASRARRRVRAGATPDPETDPARQRTVVDAFLAVARGGDFDGLVAVLHPDIVLRSDGGDARPGVSGTPRGAAAVAEQALIYSRLPADVWPALVNGAAGVVLVRHGKITEIDILVDPVRLRRLDLALLDP